MSSVFDCTLSHPGAALVKWWLECCRIQVVNGFLQYLLPYLFCNSLVSVGLLFLERGGAGQGMVQGRFVTHVISKEP